jgi:hypothetical protein
MSNHYCQLANLLLFVSGIALRYFNPRTGGPRTAAQDASLESMRLTSVLSTTERWQVVLMGGSFSLREDRRVIKTDDFLMIFCSSTTSSKPITFGVLRHPADETQNAGFM